MNELRSILSGSGSGSGHGPGRFRREWLAEGHKRVVPVPAPSGLDRHLARRVSAGAVRAGHGHIVVCRLGDVGVVEPGTEVPATEDGVLRRSPWPDWRDSPDGEFLIVLPDGTGALLVTGKGYALFAGKGDFLRGGLPEGDDQVTVDFLRYAKRVGHRHPAVLAVVGEARPFQMAWASKSDIAEGAATAQQVGLMESFAADHISGEEFAAAWLGARREALHLRERLREPFSRILDHIFYALDHYVIDPDLRDADDLTNEQLRSRVREGLADLDTLEHGR
ncbi:colicin immunity domain-containing protein [Streptomyces sp. NPDC058308]|uniref:colicin immunity domain-containing protein n=1 Tax=Streptomyces sp. NPDC058308 TaxID=3346440 RepID=UPI0036F0C989